MGFRAGWDMTERNRAERNKSVTLKRVLHCAVREFANNGYHAARVADIAAMAQCSTETIYDVYENKAGLFGAAVDHVIALHFETVTVNPLLDSVLDGVTCPIDGLCRVTTLYGKPLVSEDYPALLLQLFGAGTAMPKTAWAGMIGRRDAFGDRLVALVRQGQDENLVMTGDPQSAAHLMLRAVGFMEAWRRRLSEQDMTMAHIHECARVAVRAFATPAGQARLDALPPFYG